MTTEKKIDQMEVLPAIRLLHGFIGKSQMNALGHAMRGEERQFFYRKMLDLAAQIKAMPKTYDTDGQGMDAVAHLHYFGGGADWWITEKDSDPDGRGQIQAFGLADLFRDGGELGYISIVELIGCGVELDLYWTPKTLGEIRKGRE